MTKGNGGGKVLEFHHITLWVGNAKTASSYFVNRMGFKPFALREATDERPIVSHAVKLNKIIIIFESPITTGFHIANEVTFHGDFVKDVAFEVQNLDALVLQAKEGGAEVLRGVTEETDDDGVLRTATLKTYGDNTHTLIDRSQYNGILLPGYKPVGDDPINNLLPAVELSFIDHVEGNMEDGTLDDSASWYEKHLNMQRFWCVDYKHNLEPYSKIRSASVINQNETVLLSMNEAAQGQGPKNKASEFVKALGSSGVEHIALYTDDIISTMQSLKSRGAEILQPPAAYYDLINEKLKESTLKMSETVDDLKENNVFIDFDERGYMLQAFTKHVQARPTLFIEIIQRRNHRGFGAMNYKWVLEAVEKMEALKLGEKET